MRLKKKIAILLLVSMLGGLFASCKKGTDTTAETTTFGGTEATPFPEGDTWMDKWSQDPEFEALTDDESRDTKGTLANGSWFDSFSAKRNLFWTNQKNYATVLNFENGQMYYEAADFSGTTHEAIITRSVVPSENFEVEFRFKIDYYGNDNGLYVGYNGVRIVIYFNESWLRFNRDRGGSDPGGDLVYTDIGYDWHTYRIRVNDRIAKVYLDGVYLTSFVPESWGGTDGELGFFAYPSNAVNAAKARVEYVSYTVLDDEQIRVVSPAAGASCGQGVSDVVVSVALSEELTESSEAVSYYLNGLYAGESTSQNASVTLHGLKPGVYSVYAVCGEKTSAERVFVVDEEPSSAQKHTVYSDSSILQSSYILKFNVSGNGTVTAGDGMFPLLLNFEDSSLTYKTDNGERSALLGAGDYIAVVDGGVAWIYRDGKMQLSYRLPYEKCGSTVQMSGAVSDLTVEPHLATLYAKDLSGMEHLDEKTGYVGYSYALEFEYTGENEVALVFTDGVYSVDLDISEAGEICALVAPQKNAFRQTICAATEETAVYRVVVSAGIAQIYCNNIWLASWRMPESVAKRSLYVKGIARLQIRETGEKFYYSGDAEDADWGTYFASGGDLSGIGASVLKAYSRNTLVYTELNLTSAASGSFYLLARYFNGEGIFAGYDFAENCFRIGSSLDSLQRVESTFMMPTSGTVCLSLSVVEGSVMLQCNGETIAEVDTGTINGWGNAGYLNKCDGASVVSFSYEGDGNPLCNTTTELLQKDWTSCFFELNGFLYAGGEFGTFRSDDDGKTFTALNAPFAKNSWNMIVLQSGKLLSLVREGTATTLHYMAYISSNNGLSFDGPYPVNSDVNAYRYTMNGRVMQASSGRIIFVSGETENEYIGKLWLYYSDDEGKSWKKSESEFCQKTTGMNLQEGMVVELEGGILRMYARNDCGYLVYSESSDGGETWSMDMQFSNFPSTVCAFGVNKDPYTGDIYMCWEYNNANDSCLVQYPRTRVALAVSHDNAKTWEYIGDIDDLNSATSSSWVHMNAGVWFTENAILATTAKSINGMRYNYIVRIPREDLLPMARFNSLHILREDPAAYREGLRLFSNGVLAVSSETGRVYASGTTYEIEKVNGKRTMLSLEVIADFMGGVLTLEGERGIVRVGNAEYIFTAGTKTAMIAGVEKPMTFEALFEDGIVKISLEDLQNTLELTARQSGSGIMVFTIDRAPIRMEYLLALIGIR